jgi:hypothetical protein
MMELKRINGVLMLHFPPDQYLSFKYSWIDALKNLPMEKYTEYIKKEIYPIFTSNEKSYWNKNTISNRDL